MSSHTTSSSSITTSTTSTSITPKATAATCANDRSITTSSFTVTTRKHPILNSQEIDHMTSNLGITPPEMIFGSNEVVISHIKTGWEISFNAFDALDLVDKTGEGGNMLKVAYAQEWSKMREKVHEGIKEVVRPFDWSYTTSYKGSVRTTSTKRRKNNDNNTLLLLQGNNEEEKEKKVLKSEIIIQEEEEEDSSPPPPPPTFKPTETPIPLDKLRLPDPILFFDEVLLYEDELADNGISILSVKVRVMPERLLLLSRFFLRLDGVVYRIRDTRVYIDFETEEVIREYLEKEGSYFDVSKKLKYYSKEEIPGIIRDSNRISELLGVVRVERERLVLGLGG